MTPLPIAMGTIKAITDCDGRNQRHHCEVPKRSRDEHPTNATRRAVAKPQGGLADKRDKGIVRTSWVSWQYSSRNDNHHQRSVNRCNASATKRTTRRSSKQETSGRLGISCLRSPATRTSRTTIKHAMKNLQRNNKNAATVTHATLAGQATHTIDWRRPEQQQNKHALRWLQWRHKLPSSFWLKKWSQVVLLWFPLQAWPSTAKSSQKSKKKETFPSFLDKDL